MYSNGTLKLFLLSILVLAAAAAAGCDMNGPRPSWISAGCARTMSITSSPDVSGLKPQGLIGDAAKGGTDFATFTSNGMLTAAVGYVAIDKPHIAFFGWDGYDFMKQADLELQGSGVPAFSPSKAQAPAGVINLNDARGIELVVRTAGTCGEGSAGYTVLSQDLGGKWENVWYACEFTRADAKAVLTGRTMDAKDVDVLTLSTYAKDENGVFNMKTAVALMWDGNAWQVRNKEPLPTVVIPPVSKFNFKNIRLAPQLKFKQ